MTPAVREPEPGHPSAFRLPPSAFRLHPWSSTKYPSTETTEGKAMAEKKDPADFRYCPGNCRWSAAFINMRGSISYGGAEIGELHKIGRRLKGKGPEDDAAWFDACVQVADGVRAYAEK